MVPIYLPLITPEMRSGHYINDTSFRVEEVTGPREGACLPYLKDGTIVGASGEVQRYRLGSWDEPGKKYALPEGVHVAFEFFPDKVAFYHSRSALSKDAPAQQFKRSAERDGIDVSGHAVACLQAYEPHFLLWLHSALVDICEFSTKDDDGEWSTQHCWHSIRDYIAACSFVLASNAPSYVKARAVAVSRILDIFATCVCSADGLSEG
jgi:hypothetical protein